MRENCLGWFPKISRCPIRRRKCDFIHPPSRPRSSPSRRLLPNPYHSMTLYCRSRHLLWNRQTSTAKHFIRAKMISTVRHLQTHCSTAPTAPPAPSSILPNGMKPSSANSYVLLPQRPKTYYETIRWKGPLHEPTVNQTWVLSRVVLMWITAFAMTKGQTPCPTRSAFASGWNRV